MERLQAALQKARVQREGGGVEALKPRKTRGGLLPTRRRRASMVDDVWQDLPELEVNTDVWQLHRLFAFKGGRTLRPMTCCARNSCAWCANMIGSAWRSSLRMRMQANQPLWRTWLCHFRGKKTCELLQSTLICGGLRWRVCWGSICQRTWAKSSVGKFHSRSTSGAWAPIWALR